MTADPKKTPSDDPLVISFVRFHTHCTIGGVDDDSWSIEEASHSRLHGRVRVEECPQGLRFFYSAGHVYQEVTVYASNVACVMRVPRSALKDTTRAFLETAGRR